jgi:hypothetical protein
VRCYGILSGWGQQWLHQAGSNGCIKRSPGRAGNPARAIVFSIRLTDKYLVMHGSDGSVGALLTVFICMLRDHCYARRPWECFLTCVHSNCCFLPHCTYLPPFELLFPSALRIFAAVLSMWVVAVRCILNLRESLVDQCSIQTQRNAKMSARCLSPSLFAPQSYLCARCSMMHLCRFLFV